MIYVMTVEPTRLDRRRERTRSALIEAATQFLAEGRSTVSIQQITDAADVGFGSFYNHFESKEALFEAAVESVLDTYAAARDVIVAGYEDPAEVFAVSFRMTGRLQRIMPEMVRVLLNEGASILTRDKGLAPRAIRDIEAGVAAGRFDLEDSRLALMAAGGALLGLLQLLESDPDADAGMVTDQMTARVLRAFGMTKSQAERLCAQPLPDLPQL
jgi:AcrR family transcriptional regulator